MQSANHALVKEVNELKATLAHLKSTDTTAALGGRLDEAIEELRELKEERSRQEVMVTAIVEQRDMYKKLLATSDLKQGSGGAASPKRDEQIEASSTVVVELRASLNASELEAEKLTEQLTRAREFEANLTRDLDTSRSASSDLRLAASRAESDAEHYRSKCERLTKSFEVLEADLSRSQGDRAR